MLRVLLLALLVGIPALPTAATADNSTPIVAGYRLYPAPARMRTQCLRAQRHVRFRVLCPTLMPRTGDGTTPATASRFPPGDAGVQPATFAQWAGYPANVTAPWLYVGGTYGGGEADPQDWSLNDPNYFFHFFVEEGRLTPAQLDLVDVPYPQELLGTRTIAGHHGKLYDQVSYAICGDSCGFTGHVTFVWHSGRITYAASLHRWSAVPNRSVLAILAMLVARLEPV